MQWLGTKPSIRSKLTSFIVSERFFTRFLKSNTRPLTVTHMSSGELWMTTSSLVKQTLSPLILPFEKLIWTIFWHSEEAIMITRAGELQLRRENAGCMIAVMGRWVSPPNHKAFRVIHPRREPPGLLRLPLWYENTELSAVECWRSKTRELLVWPDDIKIDLGRQRRPKCWLTRQRRSNWWT